jgi:hypothetical protein
MRKELIQEGWILEAASAPQATSSSAPIAPAMSIVTPARSAVQPSRREVIVSPSASSTGSTVSLQVSSEQEHRMALANDQVYGAMREVIRDKLVTVNRHLDSLTKGQGSLSKALEMQGGNIESLTEMLDEFGSRLADVESLGSATNQRLARMRATYQKFQATRQPAPVDQASELSQGDLYQDASQDAQAYDPSNPSDYTENRTGTQQNTGLESPATAMQT